MKNVVELTEEWLGTPFVSNQSVKGVGCDCFSLVRAVAEEYRGYPTETPIPYTPNWSDVGTEDYLRNYMRRNFTPSEGIAPGKILLFKFLHTNNHLGIVRNEKSFIHAVSGNGVCKNQLSDRWKSRVVEVFEF